MYAPGTVLVLKKPKSTDEKLFAYDRVRVIGPSPTRNSDWENDYEGSDAQYYVIQPITEFEMNLAEPLGRLRTLYNVETEPERPNEEIRVEVIPGGSPAAGLTPEQQFELAAGGEPRKKQPAKPKRKSPVAEMDTHKRKNHPSPLDDLDRG